MPEFLERNTLGFYAAHASFGFMHWEISPCTQPVM
jgi:hypothetical protein